MQVHPWELFCFLSELCWHHISLSFFDLSWQLVLTRSSPVIFANYSLVESQKVSSIAAVYSSEYLLFVVGDKVQSRSFYSLVSFRAALCVSFIYDWVRLIRNGVCCSDDPSTSERARVPTLHDLCYVPDGSKVHGLWMVLWGVFMEKWVSKSMEERILSTSNYGGEISSIKPFCATHRNNERESRQYFVIFIDVVLSTHCCPWWSNRADRMWEGVPIPLKTCHHLQNPPDPTGANCLHCELFEKQQHTVSPTAGSLLFKLTADIIQIWKVHLVKKINWVVFFSSVERWFTKSFHN